MLAVNDTRTHRPEPAGDNTHDRAATTRPETLLYGLSLAAVLPPTAWLVAPNAALPTIRSAPHSILEPAELEAILDRPTRETGHGRISLAELDRRLHGLDLTLALFQVTGGRGILVSVGIVRPDPVAHGTDAATPSHLWTLACEAMRPYGPVPEHRTGLGIDSMLVCFGGITAQVAWLTDQFLATVGVTSLDGDQGWTIEASRSIALHLNRRLRSS